MLPFRYKHYRQKIVVLRASFEYKRGNFSFSSSSQWHACSPEMGAPVALLNWDSWEMLLTSITGKSFGCFPQSAKLDEWTVSMKQLLWLSTILLKKPLPIAFPQRDQNFQISVRSWYYTFLQGRVFARDCILTWRQMRPLPFPQPCSPSFSKAS